MKQPQSEGGSVLAVCEFKPGSNEIPVCFTVRSFDNIRQSFEKQDAEPFDKKQP